MKRVIAGITILVALLLGNSAYGQQQPTPVFQQKGKPTTVFNELVEAGGPTNSSIYDFSGFVSASLTYLVEDCGVGEEIDVIAHGSGSVAGPWQDLTSLNFRGTNTFLELDALIRTKYIYFSSDMTGTTCKLTVTMIPYAFANTVTVEGRVLAGTSVPSSTVRPLATAGILGNRTGNNIIFQVPNIDQYGLGASETGYSLVVKEADSLLLKYYAEEVLVLSTDYTDVATNCYGSPRVIHSILIQNNGPEPIACAASYASPSAYAAGTKVPANGGVLSLTIRAPETFVMCMAETTDQVTTAATNVIYGCQEFNLP